LQAKARVQRVFDVVSGAANCTLPVTARELVVTSDDPLDGAQQLLPQLQAALAEATGGQRRYLGDCMRRVEQYLRRREEPAAPAAAGPACQPSVGLTASHMTATPSEQPAAREVEPPTETPEIAELRDSARRAMYALDQARLTGRPTRYLEREVRKRSTALYEALRRQFDDLVSRSEQAVGDEKAQLDKTADQLAAEIVDLEDELGEAPMQNP